MPYHSNNHIGDDMYTPCCHIISSDDDQPIVMDLYVGFNERGQLLVCIDLTDYEEPEYNCSTAAVVNLDDSHAMARRHRVRHYELPRFIGDCTAEWREIINPNFDHVRDCFKEITECLLDEGCRFRIIRTYGHHGHMCC